MKTADTGRSKDLFDKEPLVSKTAWRSREGQRPREERSRQREQRERC